MPGEMPAGEVAAVLDAFVRHGIAFRSRGGWNVGHSRRTAAAAVPATRIHPDHQKGDCEAVTGPS